MKIGIDVDGVLRDFCQGLEAVVKKHYPQYLPEDYTGINNWKLSENFTASKPELQKIYWDEFTKEIMGESPAFEEIVRQMKNLISHYQELDNSDITFVASVFTGALATFGLTTGKNGSNKTPTNCPMAKPTTKPKQ